MPAAAYYAWDRAGRPLTPAQPIREVVERLRLAYPRAAAANLFSWHADESHYRAVPAQDHTPFSQTGWPVASPQWWVFATDVMHRPDLGVDCHALFAYWIGEARAGRMPWLKYIIWQALIYDVRNEWRPQASSGHYDHAHLSARTDHRTTSLGSWSLLPGGDDDTVDKYYLDRIAAGYEAATRVEQKLVALTAVVQQLGKAIEAGGGSVDTAAILAGVDERLAALVPVVAEAVADEQHDRQAQ